MGEAVCWPITSRWSYRAETHEVWHSLNLNQILCQFSLKKMCHAWGYFIFWCYLYFLKIFYLLLCAAVSFVFQTLWKSVTYNVRLYNMLCAKCHLSFVGETQNVRDFQENIRKWVELCKMFIDDGRNLSRKNYLMVDRSLSIGEQRLFLLE